MAKKLDIVLKENHSDGRRHLNLTIAEREGLAKLKQIEHAVSMFLDLEQARTSAQIAAEMGISVSALKRLTTSPEFQRVYDEARLSLGHHPSLLAMQSSLPDLLPLSYNKMHTLLTRDRVADTAAVAAIKLLWETVGMKDLPVMEDPQAMNNFMKQRGVSVDGDLVVNVNLPIPEEYKKAFSRLMGADIVDAEVRTSTDDQSSEVVVPTE